MTDFVLAADLGGTNLRIAAVKGDGEIVALRRASTPSNGGCYDIAEAIAKAGKACSDELEVSIERLVLGLAVPALLDSRSGIIHRAPNLPQLDGNNLADAVAKKLGCKVVIENDANAAALGEHRFGASKGCATSVCVTLGTGVGGGLILDGELWRGIDGTAGELGHVCVEPEGLGCGCGSKGCLEQYASATAVVERTREMAATFPSSSLSKTLNQDFSAKDVYEAGKNGDELAIEVFRQVG
ncbi:MAG: ROK family protein, partial [Acidobacteria bacterium]|nr:ROK family protein [Acidobacteriota bacterium]